MTGHRLPPTSQALTMTPMTKAWEELLQHDLTQPEVSRHVMAIAARLFAHSPQQFVTAWLPQLNASSPSPCTFLVDDHLLAECLVEHLPTHHTLGLTLAGRLLLWCELFTRRRDLDARLHLTPHTWPELPHTCEHKGLQELRRACASLEMTWSLTRKALRQSHLVPKALYEEIRGQDKASGATAHGQLTLGPWNTALWRPETYPNSWMTVDYHAREALKLGTHSVHCGEDIFLIAARDEPRSEAYVGAASHVDGGSFGGIPACMTQTRYRDLETFLTMGARRAFCVDWTLHTPADQDFGAFAEVEAELYTPEYLALPDEPDPPGPVEEALRRRSASPELGAERLQARLSQAGVSDFAVAQMWGWLEEDIVLLLEHGNTAQQE